jgi:hypothetical protein
VRTLAIDPTTGDLAISGGRPRIAEGLDATVQKLRVRLKLWQGEWPFDRSVGIPYRRILGEKGVTAFASATLRRAIETSPGVATLDAYAFTEDRARRSAALAFRATSVTGEPITITDFAVGG